MQLEALFGRALHPITGRRLGRPWRVVAQPRAGAQQGALRRRRVAHPAGNEIYHHRKSAGALYHAACSRAARGSRHAANSKRAITPADAPLSG
jgi:hypothetical protein